MSLSWINFVTSDNIYKVCFGKGGPLENLSGGGERAKYPKNIRGRQN